MVINGKKFSGTNGKSFPHSMEIDGTNLPKPEGTEVPVLRYLAEKCARKRIFCMETRLLARGPGLELALQAQA
jgi:hypothetical protein